MVFNAFSIASTSTFAEIGSGYDYGDGNDINNYTPGTAGGPGGRDQTLAVKSRKNVREITFFSLKKNLTNFFLHISSSYVKILGGKLFRKGEFPQSGSKAKNGKKEGKKRRKKKKD